MSYESNIFLANKILAYPMISQAEVEILLKQYLDGDQYSFDRVIQSHLYLVIQEVWRNIDLPIPIDDMICEGMLALCKATNKYRDFGQNYKSYARSIIHWRLKSETNNYKYIVRLPINIDTTEYDKMFNESIIINEPLSSDEYTVYIENIIDSNPLRILRQKLEEDNIEFCNINSAELFLALEDFQIILTQLLNKLDDRQREVVKLYYGINRIHELTLEEIGELFSLTRERVRQIKQKAINRMIPKLHIIMLDLYSLSIQDQEIEDKTNYKITSYYLFNECYEQKKKYFLSIYENIIIQHQKERIFSEKDYQELEQEIIDFLWTKGVPQKSSDIKIHMDDIYENTTDSLIAYAISKSSQISKIKKDQYVLNEWGYIPLI